MFSDKFVVVKMSFWHNHVLVIPFSVIIAMDPFPAFWQSCNHVSTAILAMPKNDPQKNILDLLLQVMTVDI